MTVKENNPKKESTKELLKCIKNVEEFINLDTFKGQFNANWRIGTFRGRPSIFDLSRFIGDVIFFDRSWIIAGNVDWRNINFGKTGTSPFYVEYTQNDDLLKIQFMDYVINVPNAQNSALIQLRYDFPSKKIIFVFRQNVPTVNGGNTGMFSNSFMIIEG